MPRRNQRPQNDNLQNALPLFHYMLNLFHQKDFNDLVKKANLTSDVMEEDSPNGESRICEALVTNFLNKEADSTFVGKLSQYDENIKRFTEEINKKRSEKIRWKYFQYLILLFTEIYLDNYFDDKRLFADSLNAFEEKYKSLKMTWDGLESFSPDAINKLAFWCATGSGKTLLMHIQIKQFLYYAKKYGVDNKIDNVLLITPSRELSQQHYDEFQKSGIPCEIFSKDGGTRNSNAKNSVKIIEITKFRKDDDKKAKKDAETVPVSAFEGHNLVLVDEAHKGSGGEEWLSFREKLTKDGFSFEYSATFGQAIGALTGAKKTQMLNTYGMSTLFDYSYRYFYDDGYGKDYRIMNMDNWPDNDMRYEYLSAYLLTLYEQKLTYFSNGSISRDFLISNPLGVFVGAKVKSSDDKNDWIASDVMEVILFLNDFIKNRRKYCKFIANILNNATGLVDEHGDAIFEGCFPKLHRDQGSKPFSDIDADRIYTGILDKVFNNAEGGILHIDQITGSPNELGLRLGNSNKYFGLVYVGKTDNLRKKSKDVGIDVSSRLMPSLFKGVTREDSTVNILIGAKMFAEGWSSWRVSVMGLMRFGKSEGSMIIQMFGRGVRLKGYGMSLKRSSKIDEDLLPEGLAKPQDISVLETLNVFGVSADYMRDFKTYLAQSGLGENDSSPKPLEIKTVITDHPKDLELIREDERANFIQGVVVNDLLNTKDKNIKIVLDWYPTIKVKASDEEGDKVSAKNEGSLKPWQLQLINWDEVYFAIEQFKADRRYYNLEIRYDELKALMGLDKDDNPNNITSWYTLYIPKVDLEFTDFEKDINRWQRITIELLKQYIAKFYHSCEMNYRSRHQKVEVLTDDDEMLVRKYTVLVRKNTKDIERHVNEINYLINNRKFNTSWSLTGRSYESLAFFFDHHLYNPLIYFSNDYSSNLSKSNGEPEVSVSPVPLNDGERKFVDDLKKWLKNHSEENIGEVFLLRNPSKKGLGFFVSEGFYPDFILWILKDEKQYLTFIDPKGIRQLEGGLENEKVKLFKYLREIIAPSLSDKNLILNSFIISNTKFSETVYKDTLENYNANHVYFQKEQEDEYINMMMRAICN